MLCVSSSSLATWAQSRPTRSCQSALGTPGPFLLLAAGAREQQPKGQWDSLCPSSLLPHHLINRKESEGPLLATAWMGAFFTTFLGSSHIPATASHGILSLPLPESYVSLSTRPCHKAVSCCAGSEMLPYLQTNPVSWQKTQNSWVRDQRLWSLWHSRQHGLHVPLPFSATGQV